MTTTPHGLLTDRPAASPPIAPVAPGIVRFGGLVMTSERARRLGQQLLLSAGVADERVAAPEARAGAVGVVTVTLYGLPAPLTLDEALLLLGELRAAIRAASALGAV